MDLSACTAAAIIFVSLLKKGMISVLNFKNHGTATNPNQLNESDPRSNVHYLGSSENKA